MNPRDRFLCVMEFEKPDRLPRWEIGFWPETLDRWHAEGLPVGVDPQEYLGLDEYDFALIDFNFVPAFEQIVLEEGDDVRIVRDQLGCVKKEFKYGSAMPHYMEFPIKSRADYLDILQRLDPSDPSRYPRNWTALVDEYKSRDYPLGLLCRGLVAFGRDFMNFNHLMMTFMDDPGWISEMMDFHTDFMMKLWERALSDVQVDFVQLGEDMAYNAGPMIGPSLVREMMLPRYRRLIGFLRDHGVRHIIVDSDGDIRSLVPLFIEAGITCLLPMECAAGCDVRRLRERYPRLQMIGGLDKRAVAAGGDEMVAEVTSKVEALAPQGGYIPGFDHSVHPEVSLAAFREYNDLLFELSSR